MKPIKLVLVGDGKVGKTSLIVSYAEDKFEPDFLGTYGELPSVPSTVDGVPVSITLWDTKGQDEYDQLRHLWYPRTDIFLICFSLVCPDRSSFVNVTQKWIKELNKYCPKTPKILVGTKLDLRISENADTNIENELRQNRRKSKRFSFIRESREIPENDKHITHFEGTLLAEKIGAVRYIECSACSRENIQTLFEESARIVLNRQNKKAKKSKKKCNLL